MFALIKLFTIILYGVEVCWAHEAKDLDDSVWYKIDFEMPDFDKNPELKSQLMTFYTHEKEKYDCVIPIQEELKEDMKTGDTELKPNSLLQPLFTVPSCSYRIEAYWSYEICHGMHVRQYHEEREGKNVKFQEYYLGKWTGENMKKAMADWDEARASGRKYKTTKIDNTKYPYFELEMADGTLCDIINAPRTTLVRYVCYPHGKNEIYSFKETSSCQYEAIILTSVLCSISGFRPQESKEVPIKCFNSPTDPHKPLSMLKQEAADMHMDEEDFPELKDVKAAMTRNSAVDRFLYMEKFGNDVDNLVLEIMAGAGVEVDPQQQQPGNGDAAATSTARLLQSSPINHLTPIKEFISGKNCLTGGTGWWKYEFCYGSHVRQFHKDKKSETELFLGYFSDAAHRQWIVMNPEKSPKRNGYTGAIWHHYEKGTRCDRTGLPREVDVKLTCVTNANSATAVSMYLLEPKTCQYILVVESPIICDLIKLIDEYGLVLDGELQQLIDKQSTVAESLKEQVPDNESSYSSEDDNSKHKKNIVNDGEL